MIVSVIILKLLIKNFYFGEYMLFNSFEFLGFFTIVLFLYYLIPHRFRWIMLLISSYYFYASWNLELIVLIAGTTVITYACGRLLDKKNIKTGIRKLYLTIGVALPLLALVFFKYFNFFGETINSIFDIISIKMNVRSLNVILPVGISFYTFQTLSYVIDVYRGEKSVEKHIGIYALYVSFFPQLVAGPIERSTNLLPQFKEVHSFDYKDVTYGLKKAAVGLFKKIVIADSVACYVDMIYNNVSEYSGLYLILATVLFAIQIYCDFSAYSDIAIGVAQMMGFRLMKNFDSPYFSKSIKEFWRRWHISLSSWFRDYIYIPLGGNRVRIPRYYLNIFITFTLSGLWHGANYTFLVWGSLYGLYMIFGAFTEKARDNAYSALKINQNSLLVQIWRTTITFSLVCFAWVFFRSNNINDALYVITHSFDGIYVPIGVLIRSMAIIPGRNVVVVSILLLFVYDYLSLKMDILSALERKPTLVRWVCYFGYIGYMVIYFLLYSKLEGNAFIYFQF